MNIKQAVILAGGKGERLMPLTKNCPKPMVEVAGKPFIFYLIQDLKKNGIKEIVLLTGYLHEKIEECLGDGRDFGLSVKYSFSPMECDTGARLRSAKDLLDENFLLMFGDNYWPAQLKKMSDFFEIKNCIGAVTVYNNKDGKSEYGFENEIKISDDGLVEVFDRTRKEGGLQGVIMGYYIFNKKVFDYFPEGNFHLEKDLLPILIKEKKLFSFRTDHQYYPITDVNWLGRAEKFFTPKKVIFLDRDGVINKKIENGYVTKWDEFEFLPNTKEALKYLTANNYEIYIITNQRGIHLGVLTEGELSEIHEKMINELSIVGVSIKGIYYCPHQKDACFCRKPKPGMFYRASGDHFLDLTKSFFIGDSDSDKEAADAAGINFVKIESNGDLLAAVKSLY